MASLKTEVESVPKAENMKILECRAGCGREVAVKEKVISWMCSFCYTASKAP